MFTFLLFCLVAEYCAYVEECNNEVAYNEAIEHFPAKVILAPRTASEAHSLAHVLKGIKKPIEVLRTAGNDVLPLCKAISFMPGSVDVLWMTANHLSMLPEDIIDRLVAKINKKLKMRSYNPPNNKNIYNEKLAYLQRIASSLGKPVIEAPREYELDD